MASSRSVPGRAAATALRRGVAVALLLGAGLQGAAAQGYSWGYGLEEVYGAPRGVYYNRGEALLPPRAVADGLEDRGFSEIGRPRFDGRAYVVEATSPRGARLRLVVDARDGAVIGREALGAPYYPSVRPRPAAPGYGWTEDDARPRRLREAELILPPADIPSERPSALPPTRVAPPGDGRVRAERQAPQGTAHLPQAAPQLPRQEDANPLGLNPDSAGRPDAARRAARPAPSKPATARVSPPAPEPTLRPAEAPPAREATPAAKAEERPAEAPAEKAAESPKPAEPAKPAEPTRTADSAAPSAKPADKTWQDPPADGPRKPVRVIGGATVVPGGTGEAGAN